jgi:hypothetical protein
MRLFTVFIFFLILFSSNLLAQEESMKKTHQSKHSIALVICHTQINEGFDEDGEKQWLSLPSWGINYNYTITNKWSLGVHTDIIIEDFKVEKISRNGEVIERSYPVASALVASYKFGKNFNFLLGSGMEFAKENSYFLIRSGFEYGMHINHKWEFIVNIVNDYKFDGYNSWGIGAGLAYKL